MPSNSAPGFHDENWDVEQHRHKVVHKEVHKLVHKVVHKVVRKVVHKVVHKVVRKVVSDTFVRTCLTICTEIFNRDCTCVPTKSSSLRAKSHLRFSLCDKQYTLHRGFDFSFSLALKILSVLLLLRDLSREFHCLCKENIFRTCLTIRTERFRFRCDCMCVKLTF